MAVVGMLLVLAACAGSPTQYERELPRESEALAEELQDVSSEMLTEVINDKARLADLDYALSLAAARYCGRSLAATSSLLEPSARSPHDASAG